jgi:two-component system phosphate regulon sensor histidine kinase PhoR
MFKENSSTKFLLFYLVLIYVFAFLFWWSYLLYSKIEQHYSDAVNYRSLQFKVHNEGQQVDYIHTEEFKALDAKFNRQKVMIITEGSVFFFLLVIGMLKVHESFRQEIALAKQQKNFILSITHELKSPLAGIKLMNETLKMRDLPKDKQNKLLASSLSEVDRLENLVENILTVAKIENDQYGFNKESIALSTLCEQMFINYKERKDISLRGDIEPELHIEGDKTGMNSILSNLLDNAIKYAENSEVLISLHRVKQTIELVISDQGNGIPDEEKAKIFDKFYRIGNEETRSAKGTGLGLFIVKHLVTFHNGKIKVEDNNPKGTRFIISIAI